MAGHNVHSFTVPVTPATANLSDNKFLNSRIASLVQPIKIYGVNP